MEMTREANEGSAGADQAPAGVVRQFETWRADKQRGERIPLDLWRAAASLYPRYSLDQIARALRLDSVDLKGHVRPSRKTGRPKREQVPAFVPMSVVPAGGVGECHIRLSDGRRARLAVRVKGAGVGALVELLRELPGCYTPSIVDATTEEHGHRCAIVALGVLVVFGCLGLPRFGFTMIPPAMKHGLSLSEVQAGHLAVGNMVATLPCRS